MSLLEFIYQCFPRQVSLFLSPPIMIVTGSLSVRLALFSATQRNWDPFTPTNATNSNTLTTVSFPDTSVVILYTSSSVMLPPSPSSQMMVGRGTPVAVQLSLMKSPMAAVTLVGSSGNEGETVKCGRRRVRRKRGRVKVHDQLLLSTLTKTLN